MFRRIRSWFNIKVIFGAIIFAGVVFLFLSDVYVTQGKSHPAQAPATAILDIIEAPTNTPIAPKATSTPMTTPTSTGQALPPSGDITIGDYVQGEWDRGDGLRLHGTGRRLKSKVERIRTGGSRWVCMVATATILPQNAAGWGVSNYLVVVQNP